jgi:hypothetical protein
MSEFDRTVLVRLLDEIIPASTDGRFPSAVSLPVVEFLAEQTDASRDFAKLMKHGLEVARHLLESRNAPVQDRRREDGLRWATSVERREPAFFSTLVRLTYMAYYTHPSIPPLLGLSSEPPHPGGYEVPAEGAEELEELVKPVTGRGPCYREC